MSRIHRQDPIDGWHHVTNHAVGSESLFINDRDRYEFIRRMNQAAEKYGVVVAAFVLMGNHFHLVLHCPNGGLSAFMHYLESIYAREFNLRHARRGALFGAEFFNVLLKTEAQALATIRYGHRNPLELGIDIRYYPWSSYLAYVEGDTAFLVVDPDVLNNLLGGPAEHRDYVETDFAHDELRMADGVRRVGHAAPPTVEQLLLDLCAVASTTCAITVQEIVAPRAKAHNPARAAVTIIAYESRTGFAGEIASILGYRTGSALRSAVRRARRRCETDPQFSHLVATLRRRWVAQADSRVS